MIKRIFLSKSSHLSDECVFKNEDFSHDDGEGEFWWFFGCNKGLAFFLEVGIEPGFNERWHVKSLSQIPTSAADGAPPFPFPRFSCMRSKPCKGGDVPLVQRAEFRHLGQHNAGGEAGNTGMETRIVNRSIKAASASVSFMAS